MFTNQKLKPHKTKSSNAREITNGKIKNEGIF